MPTKPAYARRKSDLERMARRPDTLGELAREGLAAVSASGAFPLYAFRDGRKISPDELDSMIYEPRA